MSAIPSQTSSRVFDLFLNQTLSRNGIDRRSHERLTWRATLHIQPLDEDCEPLGPSLCAISSDISRGGIGFIYPEPVTYDLIEITVAETSMCVMAKITHNTSFGNSLYLVGSEFITD